MEKIICLNKPVGMTPLQCIQQYIKPHPEYEKIKLGYAGRLDPMADGLLLILVGEENKKRKHYEDLSKEYECEVLVGIETDTYDILGKIINVDPPDVNISLQHVINSFLGKQIQSYPPYSSQPVNGKPMYYWARENKLDEIVIPTRHIEIFAITELSEKHISAKELQDIVLQRIATVQGDFRQHEIIAGWSTFLRENSHQTYPVFRLRISCSSGTYIRSLAHNLGKKLQTHAIALSITRTKIGGYNLQDAQKLDIL